MKKMFVAICVSLLLFGIVGVAVAVNRLSDNANLSVQDEIDKTLLAYNALDATVMSDDFLEESFRQSGANVVFYYSETEKTRFTFDKDTGKLLASVRMEDGNDASIGTQNVKQTLSAEEMRAAAIQLAKEELGEHVFGQLSIVEENQQGRSCYYTISDYYEGIPTGTNIFLGIDEYGKKILSAPQEGAVFVRNEKGTVEMANRSPMIKEEEAKKIALDAVLQKVKEAGRKENAEIISCEVCAAVDTVYYWLEVISPLDDQIDISYLVAVNAHSGKVISVLSSG